MIEVAFPYGFPLFDFAIKQRMRERRLIRFIVPSAPITVHVDHDILLKLRPKIHGDINHLRDRFRVLAVDVKDGYLQHFCHIRGIDARTRFFGRRGKADLIVDDDVERAARTVAVELAHVQRLLHDTLAGKRGIAVDEDGHASPEVRITKAILLCPHSSERNRVDELQMARVKTE